MKVLAVTIAVTWGFFSSLASGAVTVIDSFTSGAFDLSVDGSSEAPIILRSDVVDSPFGPKRNVRLANRGAPGDAVMNASLDLGTGSLSCRMERPSGGGASSFLFDIVYFGGGPWTLVGMTALELDFAEVLGSGGLAVKLRLDSTAALSESIQVVDTAGIMRVPLGPVEAGSSLSFTFYGISDTFGFTLNEIRAVPEPSTALLAFAGAGALLRRRRMS